MGIVVRHGSLGFLPILLIGLLSGCSDDDGGGDGNGESCQAGTMCVCQSEADCPEGERCSPANVCLADTSDAGTGDTGGEDAGGGDTVEDTGGEDTDEDAGGEDTGEDGGEDGGEDAVEDATSDSGDSGGGDTADTADSGTDTVDAADTADAADVELPSDEYNPWIAYETSVGGNPQVEFGTASGTLFNTYGDADDSDRRETGPAWSPDGLSLVLVTQPSAGGAFTLEIIDFDAGSIDKITSDLVAMASPGWSRDGTMIAVEGRTSGDDNSIHVYDLSGETPTRTSLTTPEEGDSSPVFGGSGTTIYFNRALTAGGNEIYQVPTAGGAATALTSGSSLAGPFDLHPDALALIYPADESSSTRLRRARISNGSTSAWGAVGHTDPSVFRGGTKVAVVSRNLGGDPEIAVVAASTGTLIQQVTADSAANSAPSVSSVDRTAIDIENY